MLALTGVMAPCWGSNPCNGAITGALTGVMAPSHRGSRRCDGAQFDQPPVPSVAGSWDGLAAMGPRLVIAGRRYHRGEMLEVVSAHSMSAKSSSDITRHDQPVRLGPRAEIRRDSAILRAGHMQVTDSEQAGGTAELAGIRKSITHRALLTLVRAAYPRMLGSFSHNAGLDQGAAEPRWVSCDAGGAPRRGAGVYGERSQRISLRMHPVGRGDPDGTPGTPRK